ncbi:conserved hypothetical protein [delta proteobacterium NaphS2]|nr:conserved hypothetical protein [delta proteobacterium NaphS2]
MGSFKDVFFAQADSGKKPTAILILKRQSLRMGFTTNSHILTLVLNLIMLN